MIAGVAGGIGAYFGIDAVIVRIAFIVLTFLGGAGPFLYLIGWLGLPREDSPSVVANALRGDSPHRLRSLAAVILIVLGLLITASLSGELFDLFVDVWSIAPYLALILIAAGVALVLWPGPAGRPKPSPARPPAPAAPPPSSVYATPAPPPPTAAGSEWSVAASPPPTAAGSEWSVAASPPSSAYAAPAPPPPTAAGPEWSVASPPGPPPPAAGSASSAKRRRGRSPFGSLTVAALFVYAGAAVMLDRLDAVDMDIGVFFAIALAITGVGLLASAFAVPARGLILLGVMLSAPLLLFVGADVRWGTGVGEVRVSVTDTEDLADEYRHGVGQMVVDLRHLDPDRTDHSVELSLGVGEMLVYVPDDILTTADISVGAGNIRVWHGGPASGRLADLNSSRDLLEGLWVLPYSDAGDLDDYLDAYDLDAYERHYHLLRSDQRQLLTRLFAEEPGVGGANRFRDTLERLLDEARGLGYPWEESDDGIGISRTVVLPGWGEPEGELHLDIDVGVGEAEVITVPAPTQRSTSR